MGRSSLLTIGDNGGEGGGGTVLSIVDAAEEKEEAKERCPSGLNYLHRLDAIRVQKPTTSLN